MITVYGFGKVTPQVIGITRDLRVFWALEECDLAYQVHGLDDFAGELQSSDYLEINPFGKVPAIDDDGCIIFESGAIVTYLAEQSGRLMPSSGAERAKAFQWAFAALDTVETPLTEIAVIDLFEADAEWANQRRSALVKMARDRLEVLDRTLVEKAYLLGDQFSYPDILMATSLHQVQHTDLLEAFPNVVSYLARCEGRPAWRQCLGTYKQRLAEAARL
ncbi:glutathione S-transferase family protein [Halopseudomonas sp. SMJS2]|uniref:glutathione S-transferase family protein n=1 Tax=Halopseudomonas sp. SMJS2 TaxID=3041098 RepID=UPI0024530439|nr:glutathione S-transferase family protein [Halopseudomonas sp. SMJS2]WGK62285.1 glutathione S-transferase family protein [Halopseudomonas sp. SMJS2]